MRQWRSDDSDKWKYGFGNGGSGDVTLGGTWGGGNGGWYTRLSSGTAGSLSGTSDSTSYVWNGMCLIHQTQGSGAGNWELNWVLMNSGSNSATFRHPLMNNYSNAQMVLFNQYKNITVSGTLSAPAWNGSIGGIIVVMAKETITINGSINASGMGFRGGAPGTSPGSGQTQSGYSGESYNSLQNANGGGVGGSGGGCVSPDTAAQYNGGSGGRGSRGTDAASGGAGGGHAASGTNGTSVTATSPNYNGGYAGGAGGNAGLTSMIMGGGGGGAGGWHDAGAGTAGNHYAGDGGGIIIIMAREIEINGSTGTLAVNGNAGANGGDARGGSGGGAGGSVLLKCEIATLGTNRITAASGAGGSANGNGTAGGAGSVGRIHLDYSKSYSGSTNPTLDVRQDLTIKPLNTGSAMFYSQFI